MTVRAARIWPVVLLLLTLSLPAWAMTLEEEVRVGKEVAAEVRGQTLTDDASLNAVGARLAKVVTRRDLSWRFWVIEDMKEYNAFAAPGGFVFISRPYFAKLDANETAFVIGHEMAHVDLRHPEKQTARYQKANIANLLLRILTSSTVVGTAVDVGATAYVSHYSRVLEREADFAGYRYAERAGFDARTAVSALSKLGKQPGEHPWVANIYATHPVLSSREDQLAALKGQLPTDVAAPPADPEHRLNPGLQPLSPTVPIAIRIVQPDGRRWENPWRKSFTHLLHQRLLPQGFTIAGDDLMYKPEIGDPVEAARSRKARYLLLVTVTQMRSEVTGPAKLMGTPVKACLEMSARLVNVDTGAEVWTRPTEVKAEGLDALPLDPDYLYPDSAIGGVAWRAAGEYAVQAAKAAGAKPLSSPPPPPKPAVFAKPK